MSTQNFRINDFSLLKISNVVSFGNFYSIQNEINLNNIQYVFNTDKNKIVWLSGDYSNRLNTTYLGQLFVPQNIVNLQYSSVKLLLPQGFSWQDIYGIHIVIKTINTGKILVSNIYTSSDFKITNNKENIDGSFWLEQIETFIPTITEGIEAQVTIVKNSDIDLTENNIGFVNISLVSDLVVLIGEKVIPDFISNILLLDENQFVTIGIKTLELSKTIEQSIIDYFSEEANPTINIKYNITYGNDTYGYKSITVSNNSNLYDNVNIGLNLMEFYSVDNPTLKVQIMLETIISVNNKIMTRTSQIETDLSELSPFIVANIEHPTTNYPVTIQNNIVNNNTIIDTKKTVKVTAILQPIHMELIHDDIVFDTKRIYFQSVTQPVQLIIAKSDSDKEQILTSEKTSDNVYYFDLSKLNPITINTTYSIKDIDSGIVIGMGKVSVK